MKCACGNEQGKPIVKPYPIRIAGTKKDDSVDLVFMAGFVVRPDGKYQCWYCAFDVVTPEQVLSARELARSL